MKENLVNQLAPKWAILLLVIVCVAIVLLAGTAAADARVSTMHTSSLVLYENGAPLVSGRDRIYVACYDEGDKHLRTFRVYTNERGQLFPRLPSDCKAVTAIHEIDSYPSGQGNRAYGRSPFANALTVYATSWGADSADRQPVTGLDRLELYTSPPLLLYDVVTALEWQPLNETEADSYLKQLREGLTEASNYLNKITNGQVAFGNVAIMTDGLVWDSAHIRVKMGNDQRPSAFIGGIVAETTPYDQTAVYNKIKELDPVVDWGGATQFQPGQVFLGRYWTGQNAYNPTKGAWETGNAYRTIAHEWAHYALFLADQYEQAPGLQVYCPCDGAPQSNAPVPSKMQTNSCITKPASSSASAMAYHYTSDALWDANTMGGVSMYPQCYTTPQTRLHGVSDWETLGQLGNMMSPTTASTVSLLPNAFAADTSELVDDFMVLYGPFSTSSTAVSEPTLRFALENPGLSDVQIYVEYPQEARARQRVLYEGSVQPMPGTDLVESTLVGIRPNSIVYLYVDDHFTGQQYYFAESGAVINKIAKLGLVIGNDVSWQELRNNGMLLGLSCEAAENPQSLIELTISADVAHDTGRIAVCSPDRSVGCVEANIVGDTSIGNDIQLLLAHPDGNDWPTYGVVRVETEAGPLHRWYQYQGGAGPAHITGDAPLVDGQITVDATEQITGGANQVLLSAASASGPLTYNAKARFVTPPLNVGVMLDAGGGCVASNDIDDEQLGVPVVYTVFYDFGRVARTDQLSLLHYPETITDGVWTDLAAIDSLHHNIEGIFANAKAFNLREYNYDFRAYSQRSQSFLQDDRQSDAREHENLTWLASEPLQEGGLYVIVAR